MASPGDVSKMGIALWFILTAAGMAILVYVLAGVADLVSTIRRAIKRYLKSRWVFNSKDDAEHVAGVIVLCLCWLSWILFMWVVDTYKWLDCIQIDVASVLSTLSVMCITPFFTFVTILLLIGVIRDFTLAEKKTKK